MKLVLSILALSFSFSQAQAASYKTTFQITNPGIQCVDEDMSRFTGREVSFSNDFFSQRISGAKTADGTIIRTEVRDVSTAEQGQRCAALKTIPNMLTGTREISISRMEDEGKCNAYVLEEFQVSLGEGNPVLYGKTAYPVVGKDFSAWSKDICKLGEKDFRNAIKRVIKTGR